MADKKWSLDQAAEWQRDHSWLRGCNFIPSTAINQLEMWQEDTFDLETIDRELGWAAELGLNAMRVYLHDLAWFQDPEGFKDRIDQYLDLSLKHGIKTIFVLFDDCWHDHPQPGMQPAPQPGVHNSGWVKGPGTKVLTDKSQWGRLKDYVMDVVSSFGADHRVILWDLYNEPGNNFLIGLNLPVVLRYLAIIGMLVRHFLMAGPTRDLLYQAFFWARDANPSQPLTASLYYLQPFLGAKYNQDCLALSDVISFHSYFDLRQTEKLVTRLRDAGRPLVCTEYLARKQGSTFEEIMPYFKENGIGAINWGLVAGKTQTIYSWEEHFPGGEEPPLWFHDILRPDGTPYRQEEKDLIQRLTGRL